MVCVTGHHFHGDNTAIELLATYMLKLDGCVADVEARSKQLIETGQNAGAL